MAEGGWLSSREAEAFKFNIETISRKNRELLDRTAQQGYLLCSTATPSMVHTALLSS
jgi:hypothetical protein